jgi:hypothetical protein
MSIAKKHLDRLVSIHGNEFSQIPQPNMPPNISSNTNLIQNENSNIDVQSLAQHILGRNPDLINEQVTSNQTLESSSKPSTQTFSERYRTLTLAESSDESTEEDKSFIRNSNSMLLEPKVSQIIDQHFGSNSNTNITKKKRSLW